MLILISYDVSTQDAAGRKRLRRIAKLCRDHGQRVQLSVFECELAPADWTRLRQSLIDEIDPERDSLRFYRLGTRKPQTVEHVGSRTPLDLDGPLIL
jgi:CRISPR-associated protein Cas2